MKNPLLEFLFVRATVDKADTSGRWRRIRLRAEPLRTAGWQPGQQVRIDVGPADALTPLLRTYSVWDRTEDTIELQMLLHGDGPGARWVAAAKPGAEVLISKPKGNFVVSAACHHLFVGEETASAAFGPMLRALPAGAPVNAVIEVGGPADQLELGRPVTWLHRGDRAAASSAALLAAVAGLTLPEEAGQAYIAGEARTVQAVKQHLIRERGWPRRAVLTKPFWTPGKKGME